MKLLFSATNLSEVGLLKSMLEDNGIECEIRNAGISNVLPGAEFAPGLWVLRDENFAEAREIRDRWTTKANANDAEHRRSREVESFNLRAFLLYLGCLFVLAGIFITWRFARAGVAIPGVTAALLFAALGAVFIWGGLAVRK